MNDFINETKDKVIEIKERPPRAILRKNIQLFAKVKKKLLKGYTVAKISHETGVPHKFIEDIKNHFGI